MSRKFSIFISLLLPSSVLAWDAPWKYAVSPSAPWSSAIRREGRENFFSSLAKADLPNAEPIQKPVTKERAEERDDDLNIIPWGAHRTLYPSDRLSSKLLWPIEGGRLISGYGTRNGRFHEGLDIAAHEGSSIRAVSAGRVVYNGTMGGYGKLIVIYHGDGISTVYAHNSVNIWKKGSQVKRGDVIALVGHTGQAEGPHCHFEVRSEGKPVDPLRFSFDKSRALARR